jgi:hypothetical protein
MFFLDFDVFFLGTAISRLLHQLGYENKNPILGLSSADLQIAQYSKTGIQRVLRTFALTMIEISPALGADPLASLGAQWLDRQSENKLLPQNCCQIQLQSLPGLPKSLRIFLLLALSLQRFEDVKTDVQLVRHALCTPVAGHKNLPCYAPLQQQSVVLREDKKFHLQGLSYCYPEIKLPQGIRPYVLI